VTSTLSSSQRQALHDLALCRTAALGGHIEHCLDCGHETIAYNSCRNRHCPKCQALTRAQWLEQQAEHLLPVDYHHVVFTLPAEIAALALANPTLLYDLLMRSAAATLREVAANPKHLGACLGVLMVLHSWGQNLHHHPHVHCVVTGGGLSCVGAVPPLATGGDTGGAGSTRGSNRGAGDAALLSEVRRHAVELPRVATARRAAGEPRDGSG
jgi:hypothetical protein